MTPNDDDDPPPDPDAPDPWPGDEPFGFTAEEIEDIRKNGINFSEAVAALIAKLEQKYP